MACEFCKGERKAAEYVGGGTKTMATMIRDMFGCREEVKNDCIRIDDSHYLAWDNSSGEYAEMAVDINYCPMCGEKLNKGE